MKTLKTLIASLATAILVTGCASNGYQKANSTASYLATAADRIDQGSTNIAAATDALRTVVDNPNGDLQKQFKAYSSSVAKLESLSKSVGSTAAKIQQMGASYFQKWDEQLALIQNEDIRNNSAERKAEMQKKFEQAKANYDSTRDVFNPLLANLRDIRTAIATDLTPAGVGAISKSMEKVNKQAADVNKALGDLSAQFRTLSKALEVPLPPPAEKKK